MIEPAKLENTFGDVAAKNFNILPLELRKLTNHAKFCTEAWKFFFDLAKMRNCLE